MQLSHTRPVVSASFDDPNLVSAAGLVPVMKLAEQAGLPALAAKWLTVPTDKGANPGDKVASLVAGMLAGADSIDDMALLRHGGMAKIFHGCYAPSTLGSFLRSFSFGHVRQLDALASRFLANLAAQTPLLEHDHSDGDDSDGYVFLDVDDTIIEVHGHQKQGSGYGYSGLRGINALIATVTAGNRGPVIVAQRLRRGACGSPRGATGHRRAGHDQATARHCEGSGVVAGRLGLLRLHGHPCGDQGRRGGLSHGADGPGGEESDRDDPCRCLEADRVHRRGL